MAATTEQIKIPQGHDSTTSSPSIVPGGVATSATCTSINSMRKTGSDRRPSFSITLPPSCSRSSHLTSKSMLLNESDLTLDGNESTAGFEEALQMQPSNSSQSLEPSGRRRSVQFIPGEDDSLINHDAKAVYLPKTPYPTTSEEDARFRNNFVMH